MSNGNMPANPVKGCDGAFIDDNEINNQWIEQCKPSLGLTKREAFAMAAMQGILSHSFGRGSTDELAKMATACADSLLKELESTT